MIFMSLDLPRGLRLPQLETRNLNAFNRPLSSLHLAIKLEWNAEVEEDFSDVSCHKSIAFNQLSIVNEVVVDVRGNFWKKASESYRKSLFAEYDLGNPLKGKPCSWEICFPLLWNKKITTDHGLTKLKVVCKLQYIIYLTYLLTFPGVSLDAGLLQFTIIYVVNTCLSLLAAFFWSSLEQNQKANFWLPSCLASSGGYLKNSWIPSN